MSCAILTPAEVLKQNAQVFNQQARSAGAGGGQWKPASPTVEVLRLFRRHPTKLFRGYTALAARNLPFTGLQFPIFEHLKAFFLDRRKRKKAQQPHGEAGGGLPTLDGIFERARITALSAALAGTGAAWVTTPIDVVKTRIMLGAGDEAKKAPPHPRNNRGGEAPRLTALDITKQILQTDGIRGMFRGAILRSLWTAFGSGLYLGCYEGGRHYLEERRRRGPSDEPAGDVLMDKERDWKGGAGPSRSQGQNVKKSAWQD